MGKAWGKIHSSTFFKNVKKLQAELKNCGCL